jgi:MoxR-like ATPase
MMEPEQFQQTFRRLEAEVQKVIVGHDDVIRKVLIAFFAGGHILLEGVPGLGKTLLVKSLSRALGMSFKRIQFTPDLMPSDIVGTEVLTDESGRREFQFKQGPIFAHVVLADEINRATPKTQSAVLDAMEEKHVTVFGVHGTCHAKSDRARRHLPVARGPARPILLQALGGAAGAR